MESDEAAKGAFERYMQASDRAEDHSVTWDQVPEYTRERWRRLTSKMLSRGTKV